MAIGFYKSVGKRGPQVTRRHPDVSIREMAYWHPNSVYQSLLDRANWLSSVRISPLAMRLTRLRGRQFLLAVERLAR
jgi:hypothetical protein